MPTSTRRKLVWSFWFVTWIGLIAGLFIHRFYEYVVFFSIIHALLFICIENFRLTVFPVQVRLTYLLWVTIGTYVPHMTFLMIITTIGLASNLFFGYCPLARMLYLLPINRNEPFPLNLVKRVFLTPAVNGRFTPSPPEN
jgi:hypothetical protein